VHELLTFGAIAADETAGTTAEVVAETSPM
jgi:hypothetical protein